MDDAVSVLEVQGNPRRYLDRAKESPVTVTEEGRPSLVIVSADEYARLKLRDREALAIEELSETDIAAIEAARIPLDRRYTSSSLD